MVKFTVKRTALAATAACTALFGFGAAGVASANALVSVSTEGPNSPAWVRLSDYVSSSYDTNNNVNVSNANQQNATSGNAMVGGNGGNSYWPVAWNNGDSDDYASSWCRPAVSWMKMHGTHNGNTSVGNIKTGNASNSNDTAISAHIMGSSIDNAGGGGSGGGAITVHTEGPNSGAWVNANNTMNRTYRSTNNVTVTNSNTQTARSGNASASGNTSVGNVTTGNASNENSTNMDVSLHNNAPMFMTASATTPASVNVSTEGPNSGAWVNATNHVSQSSTQTNTVNLSNASSQTATSGNASASNNTHVGNVSTGNASNSNATELGLMIN